ncbi:helix-turn-helix domain-containing protein [Methylosinus sp. KRF6]|uniref:helix-turn-helix domain-containing protein n=1 Tax=Methylosinus sp. KRF6 TaxID=2846853 RepID=UPI001C0E8B4C|nr:helix-turn-helix domain-containing protein [Methylosinus sp. KRF6]
MTPHEPDEGITLISAKEAADRLNISTKTLRAHVRDGALPCVLVGRGEKRKHYAFDPADVDAFIRAHKHFEAPKVIPTSRRRSKLPKYSIPSLDDVRAELERRKANKKKT